MDAERLAVTFVDLADTLVDEFDVHDLLYTLASRCVELLGAGAAGILLAENGNDLRLVVSTSERAQLVELFQIQSDEGPCLDCFRSGEAVAAERREDAEERWPNFAAAAAEQGFARVMALPMRLRGQVVGALNLFATADSPPVIEPLVPIAQAMADVATIAILQDRLARSRTVINEQLQEALTSRILIEQAKGILAASLDVSTDVAFELLRQRARSTRRRLADLAQETIHGGWESFATEQLDR
jgi:GAF domain-containing protein